jgi:hypothetical protein
MAIAVFVSGGTGKFSILAGVAKGFCSLGLASSGRTAVLISHVLLELDNFLMGIEF